MEKESLTNPWLRVIQLYVLLFWSALLIVFAVIFFGFNRILLAGLLLVIIIPGFLLGLGCLIAYYKDAKYIKQNSDESPPAWVIWTALHVLFGIFAAPLYLFLRGRRFDNDWGGLIPR